MRTKRVFLTKVNLKILIALIILIISFFIIFYVIRLNKNENLQKNNFPSQISNPASVFCIENEGVLEIRENIQGQYGVCIKNDKECDEWKFFRGECQL
jgi:putative hemolysin